MKKLLIATSALIGAAAVATSAQAEDPKVMVGGVIDFQAGFVSDDLDANQRGHAFRNDTEVSFTVHGKTDNGLGYGAVVDLEADISNDVDSQGVNASNTYVFLDGGFGRFEMGGVAGSSETLAVEASNIARGTGGTAGDWWYFANNTGGASVISHAALPTEHGSMTSYGDESTYNATKVNYYSPRFSGFQVGLSYTPDIDDRGQTATRIDNGTSYGDIIEGGINYEGQWDEVGVAAAVTGQFGDADTNAVEDLAAWNAGLALNVVGFNLAGSYGDWDDSLAASNVDQDYYTLGAGYDFGPFGASITWFDSSVESAGVDNDFENLVLSADYSLAPGLTPYIEASFYDQDAAGTANDNDGNVVIIGTELAF